MRYIRKERIAAISLFDEEVKSEELDRQSLENGAHSTAKPRDLFENVKQLPSYKLFCDALLQEQGYTCCYCGCALPHTSRPSYILEHILPIDADKTRLADYDNIMLSCDGGEKEKAVGKKRITRLHCDKAKANQILSVTPLMEGCEERFSYSLDGTIFERDESDQDAKNTIRILNLNTTSLKHARAVVLNAYLAADTDLLTAEEAAELAKRLSQRAENGSFVPFSIAVVRYLKDNLSGKF